MSNRTSQQTQSWNWTERQQSQRESHTTQTTLQQHYNIMQLPQQQGSNLHINENTNAEKPENQETTNKTGNSNQEEQTTTTRQQEDSTTMEEQPHLQQPWGHQLKEKVAGKI